MPTIAIAWLLKRPIVLLAVVVIPILYVIFIYGPEQQRIGENAAQVRLDAATNEAAKGISNAAERNRFLLDQCRLSNGLFNFSNGECQR